MNQLLKVLMVASGLLFFVVLRSVRRQHVRVEYSVSWLAAALAVFALSWMPSVLNQVANAMGLEGSATTLLFLVFVVFLGVFYRLSSIVSNLKDMNIALAQRIAILEYRLRSRDV